MSLLWFKTTKMNLFDVYSLFDLTPVKAEASYLWDDKGEKYLDLYGGHAVISVGHSHPHYVKQFLNNYRISVLFKFSKYSDSEQSSRIIREIKRLQ